MEQEEIKQKELYTEIEDGHYKANLLENVDNVGGNFEYETIEEYDEEDNFIYTHDEELYNKDKINILLDVYTSDHFVYTTDETNRLVELVKEEFTNIIKEPTADQLYFVEEFAKITFGEAKHDKYDNIPISIVTAPCGMGKSVVKKAVLKVIEQEIKAGRWNDGVVVVADRFDDINDTIFNKEDGNLIPYLDSNYYFVMKSWDRDICLNKEIKESGYKICKDCKFDQCPLQKQNKEQKQRPIVFMTNARLGELGEGLKHYKKWGNGKERTLLMIDERPKLDDTMEINVSVINKISSYISDEIRYESLEDRRDFKKLFGEICYKIESYMSDCKDKNYDKDKRSIYEIMPPFAPFKKGTTTEYGREFEVKIKADLTSDDERWKELKNKYKLYNKFAKELQHIERIMRYGGLYVCEGSAEFIQSLGRKYVVNNYDGYRTFIFDGTSSIDYHYSSIRKNSKSLYVPNGRTFENVTIYNFNYNLSKSSILNSNYKTDAVNDFLRKLPSYFPNQKIYAVGHMDCIIPNEKNVDVYVADDNYIKDPKTGRLYYFGNTKGKNDMRDATVMVQLGWNIKPNYYYAINFLNHCVNINSLLEKCSNDEALRDYLSDVVNRTTRYLRNGKKKQVTQKEKSDLLKYDYENNFYRFVESYGIKEIDEARALDIMTEFYQEIFRTKMRIYNSKEQITIITFNMENTIKQMTKQLLPNINLIDMNDTKISAFEYAKTMARKTVDGKMNNVQLVLDYLRSHDEVILKDVKEKFGLNKSSWQGVKRNEAIVSELAKFDEVRQGNTRILRRKQ